MIIDLIRLVFLSLYIILAFILAFYIPGDFFVKKHKLPGGIHFTLSTMLGLVLWAWQEWIFGWLQIRWASYMYIGIFITLWLMYKRWQIIKFNKKIISKQNILLIFLIGFGSIIMLPASFFMLLPYNNAFLTNSVAPLDNLWHLALISQIIRHIPPIQPALEGSVVTNYHYWGDMVIAGLIRVFHLPMFLTTFQAFSLFLALYYGVTALAFAKLLKLSYWFQIFLLFFLYLGGDFIPHILLLLGHGLSFAVPSIENGAGVLGNYPKAFAFSVYFFTLSLLYLWIKHKSVIYLLLSVLAVTSLLGFKANVGIASIVGLSCVLVVYGFFVKWRYFIWIGITGLFAALVYLPVNKAAGGLIFTGFWRVEDFAVHPAFGLQRLELARRIFKDDNKHVKALFFDLIFFIFFIISVFGTRLIGLFQTKHSLKKFPWELHVYLLSGMIISFLTGIFFIQKSGGANSSIFLSFVFVASSLYAALALSNFIDTRRLSKKLSVPIVIIILALTATRPLHEAASNYLNLIRTPQTILNTDELEFYKYINSNTDKDALFLNGGYLFTAFTGRNNYLGEYISMAILEEAHNVNIRDRKKIAVSIIETTNSNELAQSLNKVRNLDYIIGPVKSTDSPLLTEIFSKGNVLYTINWENVDKRLKEIESTKSSSFK